MTTTQSRMVTVGVVALLVIAGVFYMSRRNGLAAIGSFEDCKNAGYPIMESFPERCVTPDGKTFVNESAATSTPSTGTSTGSNGETSSGGTQASHPNIRVDNVSPNQVIGSPITITGEARKWYFEASFPVELVDATGKRLAAGPAQAQGDWMTSDFVPFKITLTFPKPTTETGTLIFRNDNPSGLPENQEEYRIPVRFSTQERAVSLYYYNPARDKDASGTVLCSSRGLVPVSRMMPVTSTPVQDTIKALLRGEITASEKASGITTEFPLPGVTLTGASLSSSGALTLSISDPQNKTGGGACRAQVLRAQVEATAKQFDAVKSVAFSPDTVFQP